MVFSKEDFSKEILNYIRDFPEDRGYVLVLIHDKIISSRRYSNIDLLDFLHLNGVNISHDSFYSETTTFRYRL